MAHLAACLHSVERSLHAILVCRLVTGLRKAAKGGALQSPSALSETMVNAGVELTPLGNKKVGASSSDIFNA